MISCRSCQSTLFSEFLDLGSAPPSNAYLKEDQIFKSETYFPLRVIVCNKCWLVQTVDLVEFDDMFNSEYAYFSNYSETWRDHCARYSKQMIERFSLNRESIYIEIASNDGCLLNNFFKAGIQCIGIEPTESTALASKNQGHTVIQEFLTIKLAEELENKGKKADLIAANNVIAHVPNISDFIKSFSILLKPSGVITFEFPYLYNLIIYNQFDTIYHEHFSYFSLTSLTPILSKNNLSVFDVEELTTHGGSLRIFCQHKETGINNKTNQVEKFINLENKLFFNSAKFYDNFYNAVVQVKFNLLTLLIDLKMNGKNVIGYGAAAKGNTLINYCGINSDLIKFIVDKNPHKINKYLPGSHIPIMSEKYITELKPDYILILPWNLKEEIINQLAYVSEWNCKFILAIPHVRVL